MSNPNTDPVMDALEDLIEATIRDMAPDGDIHEAVQRNNARGALWSAVDRALGGTGH